MNMSKLSSSYFAHLELNDKQVGALIRSLVSLRLCLGAGAQLEVELTHSGAVAVAQWGLAVRLMAFALGLIATLKWFTLLGFLHWFCGSRRVAWQYFYVS